MCAGIRVQARMACMPMCICPCAPACDVTHRPGAMAGGRRTSGTQRLRGRAPRGGSCTWAPSTRQSRLPSAWLISHGSCADGHWSWFGAAHGPIHRLMRWLMPHEVTSRKLVCKVVSWVLQLWCMHPNGSSICGMCMQGIRQGGLCAAWTRR